MAIGNKLHIFRVASMLYVFKHKCVVCNLSVTLSDLDTIIRDKTIFPVHKDCRLLDVRVYSLDPVRVQSLSRRAQILATKVIKGQSHKGIFRISAQLWNDSKDYQRRVPRSQSEKFLV